MLMENITFAKRSKHCCMPDCTSHIKEKFTSFAQMLKGFLVAMLVIRLVWTDPMNSAITVKKKMNILVMFDLACQFFLDMEKTGFKTEDGCLTPGS